LNAVLVWSSFFPFGLLENHWYVIGLVALITFLGTSARRVERRCPRCQHENRGHAKYCAQCGAKLPNG